MQLFRQVPRLEIRLRGGVKLLRGLHPLSAKKHRENCLGLFCSRGGNVTALDERLLDQRPSSNALVDGSVRMFADSGGHFTVADDMVSALAGTCSMCTPRIAMWYGADPSIERCGSLESVRRLWSGGRASRSRHDVEAMAPTTLLTLADVPMVLVTPLPSMARTMCCSNPKRLDTQKKSVRASQSTLSTARWHRDGGDQKLAQLIMMRLIMLRLKDAVNVFGRSEPMSRMFRASTAASLVLESEYFQQIGTLLSEPEMRGTSPDGALTARHRCLCFRMSSRMGCCVEELLAARNQPSCFACWTPRTPSWPSCTRLRVSLQCVDQAVPWHMRAPFAEAWSGGSVDPFGVSSQIWDGSDRISACFSALAGVRRQRYPLHALPLVSRVARASSTNAPSLVTLRTQCHCGWRRMVCTRGNGNAAVVVAEDHVGRFFLKHCGFASWSFWNGRTSAQGVQGDGEQDHPSRQEREATAWWSLQRDENRLTAFASAKRGLENTTNCNVAQTERNEP